GIQTDRPGSDRAQAVSRGRQDAGTLMRVPLPAPRSRSVTEASAMGDVLMRTLGCRGRRFGVPLAIGVLALGLGCTSSKPARVVEAAPVDSTRPGSTASAEVPTSGSASEVRSMEVREGAPETYLELGASAPLVWTSFRNADGQVVLELPNSKPGPDLADLAPSSGLVSSVRIERDSQGTRPLMRLVLQTRQEV